MEFVPPFMRLIERVEVNGRASVCRRSGKRNAPGILGPDSLGGEITVDVRPCRRMDAADKWRAGTGCETFAMNGPHVGSNH
jgi:hypothetical protein